jgi:hypothetical protein
MSRQTAEVPDVLVLAAIERADRHRARDTHAVPIGAIKDHLGLPLRSRRVRSHLEALEAAGLLKRSRLYGVNFWGLTSAGRRRLTRARRAGNVPELPESPQHREWREARRAAETHIAEFRDGVSGAAVETFFLLDAGPPIHSDAWFEMAKRLERNLWRLGSATYCLYEWAKPENDRADIDDHQEPDDKRFTPTTQAQRRARRHDRRNIRLWDTPAREAK